VGLLVRLLLEPQRSNLILDSEYFSSSTWQGTTGAVLTENDTTSPEGVQNATKIEGDGAASFIRLYDFQNFASAGDYSFSFFAKAGNANFIEVSLLGYDGGGAANFDLLNGTIDDVANGSIEDYGNGWYRCTCIKSIGATDLNGSANLYIRKSLTENWDNAAEANGKYVYIYGAMLEEGSYPTSYIPTYGSSVTRSSDALETSPYDYQSQGVLGANVGTIILDCETIGTSTGSNDFHMFGEAKSIADGYLFRANTGTTIDILERDSNSTSAQWTGIAVKQTRNKIAVSYSGSDVDVYANGVAKSLSSGTPVGGGNINGFANSTSNSAGLIIHQILLFPNKLTNDELADLTTL
jgi:hypothetical protein